MATNISETDREPETIGAPPPDPWLPPWLARILQLLVPGAVALSLVSLLSGERARVDCELRLQTPTEARPGSSLPIRGLFYVGLQSIEGPRLQFVPAEASLLVAGRELSTRVPLRRGLGDSLEATLPLDPSLRGPVRIRVTAHDHDSTIVAETDCTISDAAPPAITHPRPLRPLQQLAAGPLHSEGGAIAPNAMEVAVVGGACAPEQACEVLIWVGEPAAQIGIDAYGALEVLRAPPAQASHEVVTAQVRVHGPEAELRLHALREHVVVARRSVRLPIAQAMVPLFGASLRSVADRAPTLASPRDAAACVIDWFHEERWVRTDTLQRCDTIALPAPVPAGLWRAQSREDAFGGDAAATRVWLVTGAGSRPAQLAQLARRTLDLDPNQLLARRIAEGSVAQIANEQAVAAWLLAPFEDRLVALPPEVSSYPIAVAALEAKRARLRVFVLIALVLAALAAVAMIARRGLQASARARSILADAGDAEALSRSRKLSMTLTVVAAAASIAVAFLAIALYVLARG